MYDHRDRRRQILASPAPADKNFPGMSQNNHIIRYLATQTNKVNSKKKRQYYYKPDTNRHICINELVRHNHMTYRCSTEYL